MKEDGFNNGELLIDLVKEVSKKSIFSMDLYMTTYLEKRFSVFGFYRYYREIFPLASTYNPYRLSVTPDLKDFEITKGELIEHISEINKHEKIEPIYTYLSDNIYFINLKSRKFEKYSGSYEKFCYEIAKKFSRYSEETIILVRENIDGLEIGDFSLSNSLSLAKLYEKKLLDW